MALIELPTLGGATYAGINAYKKRQRKKKTANFLLPKRDGPLPTGGRYKDGIAPLVDEAKGFYQNAKRRLSEEMKAVHAVAEK